MNSSSRIIINTGAQYGRAIISALLSLYSTRLILRTLGMADYGIYALIGGVVALLGFITNALVITTQRHLSYTLGQGNVSYTGRVFANSILLHIGLAIGLGMILILLRSLLFDYVLQIDSQRIDVAKDIYLLATFMLQISILTAPFKAIFVAHENIVYISIVEVADAVLRVGIAIGLTYVHIDQLLFYGCMMACISILNLLALSIYGLIRYKECHLKHIFHETDKHVLHQLLSFAGWTTYGMGSVVARNQGLAMVFNNFWGTVINASYGIGNQVYSSFSFIASSIVNAFNPQIMKAEGAGQRDKMLHLAALESKFSEMLLILFFIPIILEMPAILNWWLGMDNENTTMFCRVMLITLMFDQLTYGLNGANQAIGNIRTYCLLMYTPKLLILPISILILHVGGSATMVMYVYASIELLVALMRLPYMHRTAGLHIGQFIRTAILPLLPLVICQLLVGWAMVRYCTFHYRFVVTISISILIGVGIIYGVILSHEERHKIQHMVYKIIPRHSPYKNDK